MARTLLSGNNIKDGSLSSSDLNAEITATLNNLNSRLTAIENSGLSASTSYNYFINGDMSVFQRRGTTFLTEVVSGGSKYVIDRFKVTNNSTGSISVGQEGVALSQQVEIGSNCLFWMITTGTNQNITIEQRIENLRRFCGKTLTCSMWISGEVGDTITPIISTNFGVGGSSSGTITPSSVSNSEIVSSGVPQKMSFTFTVPSYVIYSFGDDSTSYLSVGITRTTTGSNTGYFTGWMLNDGEEAKPFMLCSGNPILERKLCERYYEKSYPDTINLGTGGSTGGLFTTTFAIAGGNSHYFSLVYRNEKRVATNPVMYSLLNGTINNVYVYYGTSQEDAAVTIVSSTTKSTLMYASPYGTSAAGCLSYHYVCDAEL